MRPASIVNFERFYLAAIFISLINTILSWGDTLEGVRQQIGWNLGEGFVLGIAIAGPLIQLAIQILLWFFIARSPSLLAKWIFVIAFLVTVLLTLRVIGNLETPILVLSLVSLALRAVAAWMLFRPDARSWFAESEAEPDSVRP